MGANCVLEECIIGRDVHIADGVKIGRGALIGNGVRIGKGAQIPDYARIGSEKWQPEYEEDSDDEDEKDSEEEKGGFEHWTRRLTDSTTRKDSRQRLRWIPLASGRRATGGRFG